MSLFSVRGVKKQHELLVWKLGNNAFNGKNTEKGFQRLIQGTAQLEPQQSVAADKCDCDEKIAAPANGY